MSGSLPPKTRDEALKVLESLGNARLRELNTKNGAPDNQFGVKMGDIRVIAKSIKTNHELGLDLWESGNLEARLLATLIIKPKLLSEEELERMVASATYASPRGLLGFSWLADWLMSNIVKQHPGKEALRQRWMQSSHPMLARAGWSLTTERVVKDPEGLDIGSLLDRIDREMGTAPSPTQWTMNFCLAEIGIHFAEHRKRAVDIGERLGLYRDYPVSKGCTSPFAPIWIEAMVARLS
jgi:3-methyladenine DNA glycosylase AlkD